MPLDLDAIETRANAASPGPWNHDGPGGCLSAKGHDPMSSFVFYGEGPSGQFDGILCDYPRQGNGNADANADFIIHARTDVPALVAEVKQLREYAAERDRALSDMRTLWRESQLDPTIAVPGVAVRSLMRCPKCDRYRLRGARCVVNPDCPDHTVTP